MQQSSATSPDKKKKGKESATDFFDRLDRRIRDAGGQPKGEFDANLFKGSYPDYLLSEANLAISLVTELTASKALDLTTLAKGTIPHVAIFFQSTLKGSTMGKEIGGVVNLLNQDCQRLLLDSDIVAYADYKGKLYAANPYAFPDIRDLEPRMIWKETDADTLDKLLSPPVEAVQTEEVVEEPAEVQHAPAPTTVRTVKTAAART